MSRSINLSISDHEKQKLTELARELGFRWGSEPSISQLLKAIANGQLLLSSNHDWSLDRIQALDQARKVLIDAAKTEEARLITQLLLERSELTIPFRSELEKFMGEDWTPWRQEIQQMIRRQQPFSLRYQDAADILHSFTIIFAEICIHEKREYLNCWCEESQENPHLPELAHNWSLRLDRIQSAGVIPLKKPWRHGLDTIDAEFQITGGLALNYQPRPGDYEDKWIASDPPTRLICRQVNYPFWFFREIIVYGADCKIMHPHSLFVYFSRQIEILFNHYFTN